MTTQDNIASIEQEIYIAFSEGDLATVNLLEQQLEQLRGKAQPWSDEPYAPEGRDYWDSDWR
ncbi:hypothetical protein ACPDME_002745 [Vibrio cholerae]|uniref:hypothetical protein n=1 Tax=Vibrio TaxID=662 RepID=UPI00005F41D8|nr:MULTISPECIES: hypothetical protein [Vibrio]EKF9421003.1 hypothetical protein [Vibrio cholerae]OFI74091.1 hypothetical protein BFX16_14960 [Vibrio cholerae]OFI74679.1 hypothetical protein BFX15_15055 [Vibrio cholerae]QEO46783.1 hypothetical protein F0315_16355 [Vibrio cholerae]RBM34074.1 hypothetical protein DLR58_10195 [Vibrio tarriae]